MTQSTFAPRRLFIALAIAAALTACSKPPQDVSRKDAPAASAATAARPLLISPEDVITVKSDALASGPSITGTVQPERRADLRAEVSAVVLQVLKENGDSVRRGDLLARLDDTAIRDSLASAEAATRAASQSLEQAERQFQRMSTLRGSGMASAQQLDDAEARRNNAQSELVAAKARAVLARQQLTRTEVRAPFDGIVSDRKVSAGDTAQVGKELLKVIDPTSMRFEGLVSADRIGNVAAGQTVVFRVNGYGEREFTGKVRRVNPAANATTRQVEVLVDFVDTKQLPLAGLYGEGRIESARTMALTIPASALVREGDQASAWQVAGAAIKKVPLVVGDRDPRTGDFVLARGLAEGDQIIRHASSTLKDGQKVEMAVAKAAANTPPVGTDAAVKRN